MTYNPLVIPVPPTVGSLFDAYLTSLENRGARSLNSIRNILGSAKSSFGANCPVSDVGPETISAWLGEIYSRGAKAHADRCRAILKAVFNFGLKARFDYRTGNGMNFGIKGNPTEVIPVDRGASSHVRTRFLNREELTRFHSYLLNDLTNPSARVLMFCLLTGCRIEESHIRVKNVNLTSGVIRWETTKTGKPHQIAVGNRLHGYIREWAMGKSPEDFLIPSAKDEGKPVPCDSVIKYFNRLGFKGAIPRDACRRTFKTMGQVAGIELGVLDMIQNHSSDRSVSMLNYNRFSLTKEAMEIMKESLNKWEVWI